MAEGIQSLAAEFAADARCLPTAEGQGVIVDQRVVDQTMPASSRSAASWASARSDVDTEAPSPKGLSLASQIAEGSANRFVADALADHLRRLPGIHAGVNVFRLK